MPEHGQHACAHNFIISFRGSDCSEFIKKVIDEAAKLKGRAYSDDPLAIFDRIQNQGGFHLKVQKDSGNSNFTSNGKRMVYIKQVSQPDDPRYINHTQNAYANVALNEIFHHAKDSGVYSDLTLARDLFNVLSPAERDANPLPKTNDVQVNGRYLHNFLTGRCPPP